MKNSTEQLVKAVEKEITFYASLSDVKRRIGDSVWNNRVPSVRQVIRYLDYDFNITLAQKLEAVYTILLKKKLFNKVRRKNNRTDAYDINEFFTVIRKYVKDPALKGQLTKTINTLI